MGECLEVAAGSHRVGDYLIVVQGCLVHRLEEEEGEFRQAQRNRVLSRAAVVTWTMAGGARREMGEGWEVPPMREVLKLQGPLGAAGH